MSDDIKLIGNFYKTDVLLSLAGVALLLIHFYDIMTSISNISLKIFGTYCLLVGSSSFVVNGGLKQFTGDGIANGDDVDQDTGWLIGKLENILILSFVVNGAFTALSIVFAAKSFVRKTDTSSENTTYYLAGTLLNFTYSLITGLLLTA